MIHCIYLEVYISFLHTMQRLHYSIHIPASRKKVWDALIGLETYPQWAEEFCPGSTIQCEWKQGEKVLFTAPNATGTMEGMSSEFAELRKEEYISIHHLGMLHDGKEVKDGKEWKDTYENYTLSDDADGTLLEVDFDLEEAWMEYFQAVWPKALERIKEIAVHGESSSVTVFAWIKAPVEKVWECYTQGEHMTGWNFAADDWECPHATVDLKVGGSFSSRMQAKDGSFGFDFAAKYTKVDAPTSLSYLMEDGRTADVTLRAESEYVHIAVRFDIEKENPREMQRGGWQMILNNFKKYVEK